MIRFYKFLIALALSLALGQPVYAVPSGISAPSSSSGTSVQIPAWSRSTAYASGAQVVYNGAIYQSNAAIPANTAFATGTTGATWLLLSGSSGGGTGLTLQAVQTANFTATTGNLYPVNTTSSALTMTLPASPSAGATVQVFDYAGTWSTNKITINPNGSKFNGATNSVFGTQNGGSYVLTYTDATRGWVVTNGFSGTIPSATYTANYLIVAGGGGGGGGNGGGGGGAGGVLAGAQTFSVGTVYSMSVGIGGITSNTIQASNGGSSTFNGLTVPGGGGGGTDVAGYRAGLTGASGGGSSRDNSGASAVAGTSPYGYAGGATTSSGGSGGGGMGGAAPTSTGDTAASSNAIGGAGYSSSITGLAVLYACGGGGAVYASGNPAGGCANGGSGSGTGGGSSAGAANTGSGGGGGSNAWGGVGQPGGSGVVILSIPTSNYTGTYTGSVTVTTSGSNTILKCTSGTCTYTASNDNMPADMQRAVA